MINIFTGVNLTFAHILQNGVIKFTFTCFFKIHRKTPVTKSLFNKVTGLSCNFTERKDSDTGLFWWNLRDIFYRTPPSYCFCSTEKYFSNKVVKSPLKIKKSWKLLVRKTTTHAKKTNLSTTFIKSSYPFNFQKFPYSFFLCFPWYIESTCF